MHREIDLLYFLVFDSVSMRLKLPKIRDFIGFFSPKNFNGILRFFVIDKTHYYFYKD